MHFWGNDKDGYPIIPSFWIAMGNQNPDKRGPSTLNMNNEHQFNRLAFIIKGLPGCGKTTLGKALVFLLSKEKYAADYFDQDITKYEYTYAVYKSIMYDSDILVLGKCHHTKRSRETSISRVTNNVKGKVIFLDFYHPETEDAWKELCIKRIENRGQHHYTLTNSNPDLKNIIDDLFSKTEPITEDEMSDPRIIDTIRLDVTEDVVDWIMLIVDVLTRKHILKIDTSREQVSKIVKIIQGFEKDILYNPDGYEDIYHLHVLPKITILLRKDILS